MLEKLRRLLKIGKRREAEEEFEEIKLSELEDLKYPQPKIAGKVLKEYEIEPPFSRAVITLEPNKPAPITYNLITPELPVSKEEFDQIRKSVFLKAMESNIEPTIEEIFRAFLQVVGKRPIEELGALWYHLINAGLRAGKITPLLFDPFVEDITCSGYDLPVYVYHRNYGYIRTNVYFSRDELDDFIFVMAQKGGKDLSFVNPVVDIHLFDGSRMNITFRDLSARGSSFTIRKIKANPLTPVDLILNKTFDLDTMTLLWMAMDYSCSVMFTGATASGKTTSLNAIVLFIPYQSKVVSIEDTREIVLPHENWTALVVTPPVVDAFKLVTTTLRQRPEYIIVGEARGKEVTAMFQAMALGHPCLTTMHAADVFEVINRLASEPLNVPRHTIPLLNFVVVLRNVGREIPVRRCVGAYLIREDVSVEKFIEYDLKEDKHRVDPEPVFKFLSTKTGTPIEDLRLDFLERRNVLSRLVEGKVTNMYEFSKEIMNFKIEGVINE